MYINNYNIKFMRDEKLTNLTNKERGYTGILKL